MPYTNPHTISPGQPVRAQPIQENFDALQTVLNGGIDNEALSDDAVEAQHMALDAVETSSVKAFNITLGKLEKGILAGRMKEATDLEDSFVDYTAVTLWVDIPDFTFTVNPAVDCTMVVSGCCTIEQAGSANAMIQATLRESDGTLRCQGQMVVAQGSAGTAYNTVPVSGYVDLTANQSYTFKLSIKSSQNGTLTCRHEGGRTAVAAFLLPR